MSPAPPYDFLNRGSAVSTRRLPMWAMFATGISCSARGMSFKGSTWTRPIVGISGPPGTARSSVLVSSGKARLRVSVLA